MPQKPQNWCPVNIKENASPRTAGEKVASMVQVTMTSSLHWFTVFLCLDKTSSNQKHALVDGQIHVHPIQSWTVHAYSGMHRYEGAHGDGHFVELREKQPASKPWYRYQFCRLQLPSKGSQYGNGRNWHQIGCSIQRHPILDDNLMVRLMVLWP